MISKKTKPANQAQKIEILLDISLEKWVESYIRQNNNSSVHIYPGRTENSIHRRNLYSSFRNFLLSQKETFPIPPRLSKVIQLSKQSASSRY